MKMVQMILRPERRWQTLLYGRYGICKCIPWTEPLNGSQTWCIPPLPHGVANAVILTEVMRYNAAEVPTKMGTFSQYQYPHALARYAELGRFAGCTGKTDAEVFENFIAKLEDSKIRLVLRRQLKITVSMRNTSWIHWMTW